MYRDLKPASFLWYAEASCWKLADFKEWAHTGSVAAATGKLRHAPPEVGPLLNHAIFG